MIGAIGIHSSVSILFLVLGYVTGPDLLLCFHAMLNNFTRFLYFLKFRIDDAFFPFLILSWFPFTL